MTGGKRQSFGASGTKSSGPNWSRNSYIFYVLQLSIGNVAVGFWHGNIKGSYYLWTRDILEKCYPVIQEFQFNFCGDYIAPVFGWTLSRLLLFWCFTNLSWSLSWGNCAMWEKYLFLGIDCCPGFSDLPRTTGHLLLTSLLI